MSIENFLSRLSNCKKVRDGKWQARCPAHDDRSPSLSIEEAKHKQTGEEIILIHCFAGCGATEVLDAVGMDYGDLYPNTDKHLYSAQKREEERSLDELVLEIAAADRKAGREFTAEDLDREAEAFARKLLNEPSPDVGNAEELFCTYAYRQQKKIPKLKKKVEIPNELAGQTVEEWLNEYFQEEQQGANSGVAKAT